MTNIRYNKYLTIMRKISTLLLLLLMSFPTLFAQETRQEYSKRMTLVKTEEQKIKQFIAEHINDPIPKAYMEKIEASLTETERHDGHYHEISKAEKEKMIRMAKVYYWRQQYFQLKPEISKTVYAPPRIAAGSCDNGDFELGNFTNYTGESAWDLPDGYRYGDCGILIPTDPWYSLSPIVFTPDPMTAPEHFFITSVGPDPNVGIDMVNNGAHAARINSQLDEPGYTSPKYGVNKLIKPVVLSAASEDIYFSYALVLEDPDNHENRKPTFMARIVDQNGVECDRICNSAYASDPFLDSNATGTIRFKDWDCGVLTACGNPGDTVILEFIATDCGKGAHWGYAYVDDICDTCEMIQDTCNYHGDVELDPIDTCQTLPIDVCGTFTYATQNCMVSSIDEIRLTILQDGVPVTAVITGATISGNTFCFSLDSADFPSGTMPGEGFDFYVEIDFMLTDGSIHTENDYHANPGLNNDYVFDADCCPVYDILTCCDLTGKQMTDPAIQAILEAYRTSMTEKYPQKSGGDPCCDPCNYPTDSFPVFVTDTFGIMIDAGVFTITWSHDTTNSNAFAYLLPNQQTIVTVFNPIDSCFWTDTMLVQCCYDTIEIKSLCTWDPCLYPNTPIPLNVEDQNGNVLSPPAYTFLWSNGYTGNATSVLSANLPAWVQVTDTATGCVYADSFDISCCSVIPPENLGCHGHNIFTWDGVPGAIAYEIEITFNDPFCCLTHDLPSSIRYTTTDTLYDLSWINGCFSVMVRAICEDNVYSGWTKKACPCVISSCESVSPPNLTCNNNIFSWGSVMGATGYEVEITYGDPACCSNGLPSSNRFSTLNTFYDFSLVHGCFSVKVRARCSENTYSPWSNVVCYCPDLKKSSELQSNPTATGIILDELHAIAVPNPAEDQVTITLHDHKNTLKTDQATIVIYDMLNREIYRDEIMTNTPKNIDISRFTSGIYIYKIISKETVITADELIVK